MKYNLTRKQLQEILEIGCSSVDIPYATFKLNQYLSEINKASDTDSMIRETTNPKIGEIFLFKGSKYECLPAAIEGSICLGCCFKSVCKDKESMEKYAPICIYPNRIFKLIENE